MFVKRKVYGLNRTLRAKNMGHIIKTSVTTMGCALRLTSQLLQIGLMKEGRIIV